MRNRKSIIVYFKSPRVLKRLKKIGNVAYFHNKRKYAVLYIDEERMEKIRKELEALKHVRRVEESLLDDSMYKVEDVSSENT